MSLINVTNLSFAYQGSHDYIFENASFQLDSNWKLGFCGRNGRGKTTFLKLLMGKYEYSGTISANESFDYFPFTIADTSQHTLQIIESTAPSALLWQIQRELTLLDVGEDVLYRPYNTLSNGEQTKVLLAILFLRNTGFLLIDEPTNHLDTTGRQTVARYLNSKRGFILVSHDRTFLDNCTDHTISINKNNIEVINGNFSVWFEQKQRQDAFELAQNAKLTKEITRLEQAARQMSDWSDKSERGKIGFDPRKTEKNMGRRAYEGEKSRKMMARSKAIQTRRQAEFQEKAKLLKNIETTDALKIHHIPYRTTRLITLESLAVEYNGAAIFAPISANINQGDRVALIGSNGSGKSSIIKLICGENIPHRGSITIGGGLIISYVPQDASALTGDLSAYAREYDIDESLFKAILRKLDFTREQFDKDMSAYSAGQKKKVLLARSLSQKAHIYIWDEPLNYIDILSRMQIEELLREYAPTMIFVEHDVAFCNSIATKNTNLRAVIK